MTYTSKQKISGCCHEQKLARELNALAHPARIRILRYLSDVRSCCCKDVVQQLDLAQSTVSQHLKVLLDVGLLRMEPDGQKSRYAVNHPALQTVAVAINEVLTLRPSISNDAENIF